MESPSPPSLGSSFKPLYISGHRGTRKKAIENSARAFQYCLENRIDYIEFDIKCTADREIVVFHDARVDTLLSGHGFIEKMTLAQLRKLEYADGQKIQTLDEFFTQVGKKVRPMLEIKSRNCAPEVMATVIS